MIALVGILAVASVVILNPLAQIQKANDARRKGDLSQIQKAVETYYNDNGSYPAADTSTSNYRIKRLDGTTLNWGDTGWAYIGTLPKDPGSSRNYIYYSTGQAYYIYASLDRETTSLSNFPPAVSPTASCGSKTCNYGVSSPNVSP